MNMRHHLAKSAVFPFARLFIFPPFLTDDGAARLGREEAKVANKSKRA